HADDLVDYLAVENLRHEASANPLDLVRAGHSTREHGRCRRLNADDPDVRPALLEHLPHTRDRAAGPHARNERVDLTIEVAPDLLRRGPAVDLGVGGVRELLRDEGVVLLREFVRELDRL